MPQQDSLHLEGIACCIGQACAALKTIVPLGASAPERPTSLRCVSQITRPSAHV